MLGNVWEWTLHRRQAYPTDRRVRMDVEDSALQVTNEVARTAFDVIVGIWLAAWLRRW